MVTRKGSSQRKKTIKIESLKSSFGTLFITLESTSPMIQHRWSEKAKKIMLGKMTGEASKRRAPKDPVEEFLNAMYVIGSRPTTEDQLKKTKFGAPATWFKACAVRAAKGAGLMPMTDARGAFFVKATHGELVELKLPKGVLPWRREDPVRIQQTTDMRCRPCFDNWSVDLEVSYNARAITAEQLTSVYSDAGLAVGVGEWRLMGKQSSGNFGAFRVVSASAQEPDFREMDN